MELFIPLSVVPIGGRNQPWFSHSCKIPLRYNKSAIRPGLAHRSLGMQIPALLKRSIILPPGPSSVIVKAKLEQISRIGEKLIRFPSGTRAFWSLAKPVQGNFRQPSLPSLHGEDDSLAHAAKEKADVLGSLFASNSTIDDGGSTPPIIPRCEYFMQDVLFTQRSVRRALLSLDKLSGPDGVPHILLKTCAPELTPVLTRLFRYSNSLGVVQKSWKTESCLQLLSTRSLKMVTTLLRPNMGLSPSPPCYRKQWNPLLIASSCGTLRITSLLVTASTVSFAVAWLVIF
ncbi:unnamed protein product [Parnassius apollo]|uniref:(apollo) hypothetical protein n=1 Tax=Parnassius apollo TaxID=110799 RepID=A0A8S3WLW0_PARAO|nr:unnamed protein product [Parnassius apollo]